MVERRKPMVKGKPSGDTNKRDWQSKPSQSKWTKPYKSEAGKSEGRPDGKPTGKSEGRTEGMSAGKPAGRSDDKSGRPFRVKDGGRTYNKGFRADEKLEGKKSDDIVIKKGVINKEDENFKRPIPPQKSLDKQGSKSQRYGKYTPEQKPRDAFDNTFDNEMGEGDKLEGRNSVLEALKSGRTINKILISKGDREGSIKQIIALAKEKGLIIQEVDRIRLDNLSDTHAHQGIIAFVAVKDYVEVDDILEIAHNKGQAPFIIILDEITDSHNLGSILRSADAVGAHGVIIPKRRAVGLTPSVSKASAGAIEYVPVARVTNIAQTIDYLKEKNIWVVGTDATGQNAFYNSDLKGSIALVIGSEGEGMGRLVRDKCDFVVNIPMQGKISSLNAAVAGAIVMYEIQKQRSK